MKYIFLIFTLASEYFYPHWENLNMLRHQIIKLKTSVTFFSPRSVLHITATGAANWISRAGMSRQKSGLKALLRFYDPFSEVGEK